MYHTTGALDSEFSWAGEISKWADFFADSQRSYFDEVRCYACTSINATETATEIASGVHPGVFLTSLLLSSIPVTSNCHPFSMSVDEAPICDLGVCVKINYTARHSG